MPRRFRQAAGVRVHEGFGAIERFERILRRRPHGVPAGTARHVSIDAALAVVAIGWTADTGGSASLPGGVDTDAARLRPTSTRQLRTSAPHVFAAGDVTGRGLLVPQAPQDGFVAGTNAARGGTSTVGEAVTPVGSFTDPEYAQVGLTEAAHARPTTSSSPRCDSTSPRRVRSSTGDPFGFCKLVVDRGVTHRRRLSRRRRARRRVSADRRRSRWPPACASTSWRAFHFRSLRTRACSVAQPRSPLAA